MGPVTSAWGFLLDPGAGVAEEGRPLVPCGLTAEARWGLGSTLGFEIPSCCSEGRRGGDSCLTFLAPAASWLSFEYMVFVL